MPKTKSLIKYSTPNIYEGLRLNYSQALSHAYNRIIVFNILWEFIRSWIRSCLMEIDGWMEIAHLEVAYSLFL